MPPPTPVEVDRPDDGLDGVGEDRRLAPTPRHVLTPTEQQGGAEVEVDGHLGQHGRVHHGGAHLGQGALGHLGIGPVAVFGHDQAEHGVAQELEALVGRDSAGFGAPRAVRQGLDEEGLVFELPLETQRQRLQRGVTRSLRSGPTPGVDPPRYLARRLRTEGGAAGARRAILGAAQTGGVVARLRPFPTWRPRSRRRRERS